MPCTMPNKPCFIAHRGLSGRFPENTHAAFNAAWAAGCDGIELDIQVSRDGKLAVIHDPDTLRTAGVSHVVKETDWEILQQLDVGQGGKGGSDRFSEKIPLLADVVHRLPPDKIIQIEIKHQIDNMEAVIAELGELSEQRQDIRIQVISFDPDKLIAVGKALPELNLFLVVSAEQPPISDPVNFAVRHAFTGLDLHYPLISDDLADKMRENNLQMACWTVNASDAVPALAAKGVAFIAGDFADQLCC